VALNHNDLPETPPPGSPSTFKCYSNDLCRVLAAGPKYKQAKRNVNSYLYFIVEMYLYEMKGWIFKDGALYAKW
jgi:hypothetical protein